MGKGGSGSLRLVTDRRITPQKEYAGAPIECGTCGNRNLIETYSPRYKDGREVKGKRTGWWCLVCNKLV